MSLMLLIGLVQAEMDEKGYVYVPGRGWIPKEQTENNTTSIQYQPIKKKKRPYTK